MLCTRVNPVTAGFSDGQFLPTRHSKQQVTKRYKLQGKKAQIILTTSLTECNSGTTQKLPIWSQ
jgi:hypothetical protein